MKYFSRDKKGTTQKTLLCIKGKMITILTDFENSKIVIYKDTFTFDKKPKASKLLFLKINKIINHIFLKMTSILNCNAKFNYFKNYCLRK